MENRYKSIMLCFLISMLGISQTAYGQIWAGYAQNFDKAKTQQFTTPQQDDDNIISLDVTNGSLKSILLKIEREANVIFVYRDGLIENFPSTTIKTKKEAVTSILDKIFINSNIDYSFAGRYVILKEREIPLFLDEVVQGTVTDLETNETLPGVNIQVKGTMRGSTTDNNGFYEVSVPSLNDTLVFSFIGYQTLTVPINGRNIINVSLLSEELVGEEVVVLGYGAQKKSLVTGAISRVTSADMRYTTYTRSEQALQGKTAGVQVLPTSGAPGAGMKVRVRGYSSNGNAEPLYIVDGVKTGDINYLDPGDVANIEVLKDAASSAIYGAEGGNGVVIITTKQGHSGESTVTYEMQYGWQTLGKKPDVLNAKEYAMYMNESGRTDIVAGSTDTDWLDEMSETSPMTKHHITISGGNEKSTYLVSGSFLSQDGIITGSKDKFERHTVRLNSDHNVKDWLKVGNTMSYSHSDRKSIYEDSEFGGVLASALMMDPTTPVRYSGALPTHVQVLLDAGNPLLQDGDGRYYGVSQYVTGEVVNPFVTLAIDNGVSKNDKLLGSIYADIKPHENIVFTSRVGLDLSYQNTHSWDPVYYYTSERNNTITKVNDEMDKWRQWVWDNFATYTQQFGDHDLTVLAGISAQAWYHRYTSASGGPMTRQQDSYGELDYLATQENSRVGGYTEDNKLMSYFGRVSYNYKSRYLLQGSLRYDGASLSYLPDDGRWGLFPSISGGWIISSEDFFPEDFLITYLKLRASWGENGSLSNIAGYRYQSFITSNYTYPLADGSFGTVSEPSGLPNPDLKWETSVQTDIGIDLRAFDDKMLFSVDYYYKKTSDLLTQDTPPLEAGNYAPPINAGDVENKGFEFDLSYSEYDKDFKYSIGLNLATLDNEVTYLNPSISRLSGSGVGTGWTATYFEEGQPVWYFRGYETDGIDDATGNPNFVDQNDDGQINEEDKTYIGSAIPNLIFGGNIFLGYKGFDLNVFFQGTSGNDILIGWNRNDRPTVNRLDEYFDDRWTPTNTDGKDPAANADPKTWNSDILVKDGSYLRVKQIQVGYTLPASKLRDFSVKSARVYFSLDDYFTITKYPGFDPEAGSNNNSSLGIDRGVFPTAKKMMFGFSLSF